MNIIFFGMPSAFSATVLAGLLETRHRIAAVILPAPPLPGPALQALAPQHSSSLLQAEMPNVLDLAAQRAIPVYALRRPLANQVVTLLQSHSPEAICVACFPWRIPPALLTLPRFGFWNVHPSLLPAHRGPEPLFWALRCGDLGVTIHRIDEDFDTGPLAVQEAFAIDDTLSWQSCERAAAERGVQLLNDTLDRLGAGTTALRPQRGDVSYAPPPSPADFALDPGWSAQHAFRFMRGTAWWQQPYTLLHGAKHLQVTQAIGYDLEATIADSFRAKDGQFALRFNPGVLFAR